jgi:hypothetical protein
LVRPWSTADQASVSSPIMLGKGTLPLGDAAVVGYSGAPVIGEVRLVYDQRIVPRELPVGALAPRAARGGPAPLRTW